jgi:hypothetical protein
MGAAVSGRETRAQMQIAYERHASYCICCLGERLSRYPAVLMPFIAKRIFNHDPVEITHAWGLRDLRPGMAYSICSTLECKDCGVMFLDYRFSEYEQSLLYRDYRGEEYNALRIRFEPGYAATSEQYKGRAAYLDAVEGFLSSYLPAQPRVLDWGGGSGINSPFRFSAGTLHVFDISGVAPCPQATAVTLADCCNYPYDLISCAQVLEHVPYPVDFVRQILTALRPSTLLYLEVPLEGLFREDLAGLSRGEHKRYWHEHINFFSPASFKALALTCGLEIVAAQSLPISLGWREAEIQMLLCRLP